MNTSFHLTIAALALAAFDLSAATLSIGEGSELYQLMKP